MIKTTKIFIVVFFLSLGTTFAFAGSGHSHSVNKSTIERNATNEVFRLVKEKKLEKSWTDASIIDAISQGIFKKEWIVSFKNVKISDPKKQVLFVYLTGYGKPKGANYTGE